MQLFELMCALGYCKQGSGAQQRLVTEVVVPLIDRTAPEKGFLELYDVEQFILALDNL